MRATNAASAALTLALSGSLAIGLAGPAAATAHAPAAAPGSRAPASAPHDTDDLHVLQLRALGGLGRLSGLADSTVRTQNNTVEMSPEQRRRLDSQLRHVRDDVTKARTARTLPATGEARQRDDTGNVNITDAAAGFRTSVRKLADRPRDDAKARPAASRALLGQLEAVNTAAVADLGLVAQHGGRDGSARSAVTTTLIDRQTLAPDRLERYGDLADEVADLVGEVQGAPDGSHSQEDAEGHAQDVQEELADLRLRGADGDSAALAALEARTEALLESSRTGTARQSRAEARRLARETVKLLAAAPGGRAASDGDADAGRTDGADSLRLWTGRLLSPLLD